MRGSAFFFLILGLRELDDAFADFGDEYLGGDDDGKDAQQDEGNLIPVEQVQSRVQRHANAARADEADYGGLAHVDVPTEEGDAPERGGDLRPVALDDDRGPRGARCLERLNGAGVALFEGFGEQLAAETDGAESDGDRAGEGPRSEDRHEEDRPDQRVDRAGGYQDELGKPVECRDLGDVVGSHEPDREGHDQGQNRAERGDVERLDECVMHAFGVVAGIHGPHAGKQVRDLGRGVVEEFGDDFHGPHGHDQHSH